MLYILGALLLVGLGWWGLRKSVTVNPAALANALRLGFGFAALGGAIAFSVRGMLGYAATLAMLAYLLLAGAKGLPWSGGSTSGGQASRGNVSRIETEHLAMELDHDTGAMRGHVLKGVFAGRPVEQLAPAELALLWRDCQFTDPRSAQLIEAWLDRVHPTWREDMARAEASPGAGGVMTVREAYEILGLRPGASADDIRQAHRSLMKRMHPDAGGSSYLAAKINEAKELLLSRV